MPETPKVFQKKSKVKTWFNEVAREVLNEGSEATGNTVEAVQGYPNLPSDDSESEIEMEAPLTLQCRVWKR